ncbi:MAG: hypothetical protein QM541_13600 [Flavobacterium sp.]|nr:hypothetical protein [Flavobacterium sp.]
MNFTFDNNLRVTTLATIYIDSSVTPVKIDTTKNIYTYSGSNMQPSSYTAQWIFQGTKYTFSHVVSYDNNSRPILDSITSSVPTFSPGFSTTTATDIKHISYGTDKVIFWNRNYPYRTSAPQITNDTFYIANENVIITSTGANTNTSNSLPSYLNSYTFSNTSNPLFGINISGVLNYGALFSKNLIATQTGSKPSLYNNYNAPKTVTTFVPQFDTNGLIKTMTIVDTQNKVTETVEYVYY